MMRRLPSPYRSRSTCSNGAYSEKPARGQAARLRYSRLVPTHPSAGAGGPGSPRANKRKATARKYPTELIVLAVLALLMVIVALVGPHVLRHDPFATDSSLALMGPSPEYLLGTDNLGRCMFCRIVAGLPSALFSALAVVAASFVLGTALGILGGYFGGWVDKVVMWCITSFQVFPSFLLAVVVAGFLGPGIVNACIALIVVYWTTFARIARSLVRSLRARTFVKASELAGNGVFRTLFRHVMPNIASYMLVIATGDVGSVVLSMAGLSYLGLGMQRPTSDWGVMLSEFQDQLFVAPQLMVMVGIFLSAMVLVFTLLGDCLRDRLDASRER